MADIELIDFMEKLDPMRAESVEIFNIYATIRIVQPWSADTSASHANAVAQCKQLLGAATGRQDGY